MTVCQFYLRGQCKFGDTCRNDHPVGMEGSQRQGGHRDNTWDRTGSGKPDLPYNGANIAQDLNSKGEKPIWPLSCYAPFKHETTLIGGLDMSPEELRVKAVVALREGNGNEYIQFEANQIAAAEQAYRAARSNPSQAFEQAVRQSSLLKNATGSASAFPSTPSAFNSPSTSTSTPSAFGLPGTSAFGVTPATTTTNAFGQPAFGQSSLATVVQPPSTSPSTTTTSAFGQSSFGQPNPLGGSGTSNLIRPASGAFSSFAGTGTSAFGVGAPGTSPNATGGASGAGGFSAFSGQPSAFGLGAAAGGTTAGNTGVFGAPTSPFGGQQQQQQPVNAFSSLTNNNTENANTVFGFFGAPAPAASSPEANMATNMPSGASAEQPASAFGATGSPQQQRPGLSAFGNLNANTNSGSAFGQPTSTLSLSTGMMPSISMASSSSEGAGGGGGGGRLTAFPAPSPMSATYNNVSSQPNPHRSSSSSSSRLIDFSSIIARTTYRPGATPYDSQLPQNYASMLPERVSRAFKRERFTWAWKKLEEGEEGEGGVPEWVPPVDVR